MSQEELSAWIIEQRDAGLNAVTMPARGVGLL
jgi:hypothetical protein